MELAEKIWQRITDPVFYQKLARMVRRGFRGKTGGVDCLSQSGIFELPGSGTQTVVVIAHPDDEVFCSGLICELKERGVRVKILCLTRGEGGPCGDHPREELGVVRSAEMWKACDELGVDELVFLGHVDPIAEGYKAFAPDVGLDDLAAQLLPYFDEADLVVSHGSSGEYWHPAHLLVYNAVGRTFARPDAPDLSWLTFLAEDEQHPLPDLVNRDDPPYLRVENAGHQEKRRRALACHKTQLDLFGKFAKGDYRDFIRLTARESYTLRRLGRSPSSEIAEPADERERERDHRPDA